MHSIALDQYVPYDIEKKYRNVFMEALNSSDLLEHLSQNSGLSSDLIVNVGRTISPSMLVRRACHDLVYSTKIASEALPIKRYYLTGDYCGTAVGIYRTTRIICYVRRDHDMDLKNIAKEAEHSLTDYFNQQTRFRDARVTVELQPNKHSLVVCSPSLITMSVEFCDEDLAPKDGDLTERTDHTLREMMEASPEELLELQPGLGEIYGRFLQSLPKTWLSFVTFVKYFALLNFGPLLSMDMVEALALKILIRKDGKLMNAELDFHAAFIDFMTAFCDDELLAEIDAVVLPQEVFQRPSVQHLNPAILSYGAQPPLMVHWEALTCDHEPHFVTGLFDRSYNLTKSLTAQQWSAIGSIMKSLLILNHEGDLGLKDVYEYAVQIPPAPTARNPLFTRFLKLLFAMVLALMISTTACVYTFMESDGSLSASRMSRFTQSAELKLVEATAWLIKNDMQPIVDSWAFSTVEDAIGYGVDAVTSLSFAWNRHVPPSLQKALGTTRNYYDSTVQDAYTKVRPYITLMKHHAPAAFQH